MVLPYGICVNAVHTFAETDWLPENQSPRQNSSAHLWNKPATALPPRLKSVGLVFNNASGQGYALQTHLTGFRYKRPTGLIQLVTYFIGSGLLFCNDRPFFVSLRNKRAYWSAKIKKSNKVHYPKVKLLNATGSLNYIGIDTLICSSPSQPIWSMWTNLWFYTKQEKLLHSRVVWCL